MPREKGRERPAPGSSSPPALRGVVRDLPTVFAGAAFHPPVGLTLEDRQDGFDDDGIGSVGMRARRPVAEGGRIQWVEPGSSVDAWLVAVFAPTLADPPPVPFLELLPLGLEAGVGHNDRAANGMLKRRGRLARAVFFSPNMIILFSRVAPACSSPRCSRAPLTRFLGLLPPAPSLGLPLELAVVSPAVHVRGRAARASTPGELSAVVFVLPLA